MDALAQFQQSIQSVEKLLDILRTYPEPPAKDDTPVVMGLRGGIAALMFACWEQYIKQMFEEQIDRLNMCPLSLQSKIPACLIYHNASRALTIAIKAEGKNPQPTKVNRIPDIHAACREVMNNKVIPTLFCKTNGNPGADVVSELYENVGINNVFSKVTRIYHNTNAPVHNTWARDRLEEVKSRRHGVVHAFDVMNINISMMETSLNYLKDTAPYYAAILIGHVDDILNDKTLDPNIRQLVDKWTMP